MGPFPWGPNPGPLGCFRKGVVGTPLNLFAPEKGLGRIFPPFLSLSGGAPKGPKLSIQIVPGGVRRPIAKKPWPGRLGEGDPLTHLTIETVWQRALAEIVPLFRLIPGDPDSVDPVPGPVPEGSEDDRSHILFPLMPMKGSGTDCLHFRFLSVRGTRTHCLHQLCLRGSAAGLQGSDAGLQSSAADLHGLAKGSSGFCTALQSSTMVLSLPSSTTGFFVAILRTACSVSASSSDAGLLTSFVAWFLALVLFG
ncbi:hypothetical protein CRENBAI_009607 [Crenichthys baileyi]|uniref:Uncharacterized protein n=1 Tax=Crenichthys baileyi TaxID=28760 RepID=A0AAV9QUA3_9TELE